MTPGLDRRRLTALAPPEHLADWRLAVCWHAATTTGLLAALPASTRQAADRTGLDPCAIRAVLTLLSQWELVTFSHQELTTSDLDDVWQLGPMRLTDGEADALAQHGVWITRWSTMVGQRLADRSAPPSVSLPTFDPGQGLARLAVASAPAIGPVTELVLRGRTGRAVVLDLGGGHGEYALALARLGCRVTVQDLPVVIDRLATDPRFADIALVGKDLFDAVAEGPFDLVLCGTVTNLFDPPAVRHLLGSVLERLSPGGELAVVTYTRDHQVSGAAFGVQMLVATTSGDAHSSRDYVEWMTSTGYVDLAVDRLEEPALCVIRGRRPLGPPETVAGTPR